MRPDLVEQQKIAIEHLKTVDKFIRLLVLHLNRILRFYYDFIGFNVGGYLEGIDFHLGVGDEEHIISMMNEVRLILLVVDVG